MPGCGLAAYVIVLMSVTALGIVGLFISTSSLLQTGSKLAPSSLTYGANVPEAALMPLRAAGLLGADELPDLYHAEDMLGTRVCAVSTSALLRLDEKGGRKIALDSIHQVDELPAGVRIVGSEEIICEFSGGQGADRFARMIRASAGLP